MPDKHPEKVCAAVKALARAGKNAGEIDRMLKAAKVDGLEAPYTMPRSTIQYYARQARRDLDPLPEDDLEAANYLEREAFRLIEREMKEIRRDQKRGRLSVQQIRRAGACADELHKIRKRIRSDRAPAPNPDAQKGGRKAAEAKEEASILDRIAARHSADSVGTQTGNGNGREPAPANARTSEAEEEGTTRAGATHTSDDHDTHDDTTTNDQTDDARTATNPLTHTHERRTHAARTHPTPSNPPTQRQGTEARHEESA
jgi:hypothetical protein